MDSESVELLKRVRAGDEDAENQLFSRYLDRLLALVRTRLSPKLARKVDPEDVIQSAYRSFFIRARNGQFVVEKSGDLWRLLAGIAVNKVRQQIDRHTKKKRDIKQEASVRRSASGPKIPLDRIASGPTPDEAAAIAELLEMTMRGLTAKQREILQLYLQGYSHDEICEEAKRSIRTVRRTLETVRRDLESKLMTDM